MNALAFYFLSALFRAALSFRRQRSRHGLRDRLGVGAREPNDEPAAARIIFEIDIGERDAVRVFDREGLAAAGGCAAAA